MSIPYVTLRDIADELKNIREILERQSTTEQSSKVGRWKHYMGDLWTCTACGESLMCDDIECNNYCPNCGADMRGSDNELVKNNK